MAALIPAESQEAQQAQSPEIFLGNFLDELRRHVPVGRK
jgi:hypothetical protein